MPRLPQHLPNVDPATRARVGPSDTSDSASERPQAERLTDSDAQGTGERPEADPLVRDEPAQDIEPDAIAGEEEAGIAHSRPDPARNGGQEPASRKNDQSRKKLPGAD